MRKAFHSPHRKQSRHLLHFELPHDRMGWFSVGVMALAGILVLRLVTLQVVHHGFYLALAEGQYERSEELVPSRGEIFATSIKDGRNIPIAINREMYLLYAVPRDVKDVEATITALRGKITIDEDTLRKRLSKSDDLYEPLVHRVTPEQKKVIEGLQLAGIRFQPEDERYYPEGRITSHLTGFLGNDGETRKGQYGLEGYFNTELTGTPGYLQAEEDAGGRIIPTGDRLFENAVDGSDIVLTIDQSVQYTACTKLEETVQRNGAVGGSVLIMDPATGALLAMCGYPDFDPNTYSEVTDINAFRNPAVEDLYEPGSVMKPLTMAAAIDLGKVTPETTFEDTGSVEISGYTIRNANDKVYGVRNMTQVLEESINTGAIFAANSIGDENFRDYVHKFGFGTKVGIDLPNEQAGDVSPLDNLQPLYTATGSFGQGFTITPLQLLQAFDVFANNGTMMKPYIVKERIAPSGNTESTQPQVVREVITPKTASTLAGMLANVVINGHGKKAGVAGYYIAGKTGTAQVPSKTGSGYDSTRTIGTFAGFGPVTNPRFVMVVKIDEPKTVQFAESTAAPLFGELAEFLLHYYDIPPSITP